MCFLFPAIHLFSPALKESESLLWHNEIPEEGTSASSGLLFAFNLPTNLSFSRFISYICKEVPQTSRSLTLCIHFRRKIFKIVLLLGYWSVREECLPLQPLKNALIFVKIEEVLKKIDCNTLIIRQVYFLLSESIFH